MSSAVGRVVPYKFEHRPLVPPASGSDEKPVYGYIQQKRVEFIEIGAGSEIDSCVIEASGGASYVVSIGAPLSVPTEGPYIVRAVRVMPWNNNAASYISSYMTTNPPTLSLNCYLGCGPTMTMRRRGPGFRQRLSFNTNGLGTAATVFEFPWYARKVATIIAHGMTGAGSATMRLRGNHYYTPKVGPGGGAGLGDGIAGGALNSIAQSPFLIINTLTGLATSVGLDSSTNQSITVTGECFDTISVEYTDDGGAARLMPGIWVKYEDEA